MHIRLSPAQVAAKAVLAAIAAGSILLGQQEETSTTRLLKSSEADQIAYLNRYIAEGAPADDDAEILVLSMPSLFVPLIEGKIEEILHSRSRGVQFRNASADPERVVAILASMIEYTGEGIALKQASKLLKIDEHRFDSMVRHSLVQAFERGKGFQVAYRGLEIGDPAVDQRIMAWVELGVGERAEPNHTITLRKWAEAMVEEYKGAPDEYQWAKDPIVSRLSADRLRPSSPGRLPLHDEMFRLIAEAVEKREKK